MQIAPIRDALADAARTVVLPSNAGKLVCTGYMPDSVTVPQFFPADVEIDYDTAYGRGQDDLTITCRILVSRATDRRGQAILDALLSGSGESSVKAALEAARGAPGEAALGGLADDLQVKRMQGYRLYEHAGIQYLGAEITVRVIGPGST